MMLTTDQWTPLDGLHELPLVEALQREQQAFIKPLKYDARTAAASPPLPERTRLRGETNERPRSASDVHSAAGG
jgi:hypothetical protein